MKAFLSLMLITILVLAGALFYAFQDAEQKALAVEAQQHENQRLRQQIDLLLSQDLRSENQRLGAQVADQQRQIDYLTQRVNTLEQEKAQLDTNLRIAQTALNNLSTQYEQSQKVLNSVPYTLVEGLYAHLQAFSQNTALMAFILLGTVTGVPTVSYGAYHYLRLKPRGRRGKPVRI